VTFQIIKQSKTAHFKLVKSQNSINPENIKKSAIRDINLSFESCITGAHWKTFALDHSSRPEHSELMNTAQLIKQRTKSMQNHKKNPSRYKWKMQSLVCRCWGNRNVPQNGQRQHRLLPTSVPPVTELQISLLNEWPLYRNRMYTQPQTVTL